MWLPRRTHATLDHRQGRGGWDNTNTTREAKPGQRPPHKITSTGTFRGFTLLWDMITLRPTLLDVPRFHLGFPFIHIKPTNTASSLRGHYLYMHELVLYHEPCGSRDAHMPYMHIRSNAPIDACMKATTVGDKVVTAMVRCT